MGNQLSLLISQQRGGGAVGYFDLQNAITKGKRGRSLGPWGWCELIPTLQKRHRALWFGDAETGQQVGEQIAEWRRLGHFAVPSATVQV